MGLCQVSRAIWEQKSATGAIICSILVVGLTVLNVLQVVEMKRLQKGTAKLPEEASHYHRDYVKVTRTDLKPLDVVQPEGPSFKVPLSKTIMNVLCSSNMQANSQQTHIREPMPDLWQKDLASSPAGIQSGLLCLVLHQMPVEDLRIIHLKEFLMKDLAWACHVLHLLTIDAKPEVACDHQFQGIVLARSELHDDWHSCSSRA